MTDFICRKFSMKLNKQQKRKITEVAGKQEECLALSVKKSANSTGRDRQKDTECTNMALLEPEIKLQIQSAKVKLQLFPINQNTRLGLEKDGYNPFLELMLSASKKISSVIRHLNTKWSSSGVAIGELMLFPYNTRLEQLASCTKWTLNDTAITAGEVYVAVGRPSLFRLRYSWCSNIQSDMFASPPTTNLLATHIDFGVSSIGCNGATEIENHQEEQLREASQEIERKINMTEGLSLNVNEPKGLRVSSDHVIDKVPTDFVSSQSTLPWDDNLTNLSIGGLLSEISLQGKFNHSDLNSTNKSSVQPVGPISDISIGLLSEASLLGKIIDKDGKPQNKSAWQHILLASSDVSIGGLLSEASLLSSKSKSDTQTTERGPAQLQSPWDDNFTTLSIGGLFSEASLQAKSVYNPEFTENKSSLQPNAPFSDSFDAFVAAQLRVHPQVLKPTYHEQNMSILDAEETCHAFPIRKLQQSNRDATTSDPKASSDGCSNGTSTECFQFSKIAEMNNGFSRQEPKTNLLPNSVRLFDDDRLDVPGIKSNESSGPFETAVPSQHATGAGG